LLGALCHLLDKLFRLLIDGSHYASEGATNFCQDISNVQKVLRNCLWSVVKLITRNDSSHYSYYTDLWN